MIQAKNVLDRDYTEEDIEENMGDIDFANDFAEELLKTLEEVIKVSQATSKDCLARKHRLDAALTQINKYMNDGEEEVIELAEDLTALGEKLNGEYNQASESCSNYFEGVSSDVNTIISEYISSIVKKITSAKNTLLLREKDAYSNLKIQLFNVIDTATDVQLEAGSAQERLSGGALKVNKYLKKKNEFYYSNKY